MVNACAEHRPSRSCKRVRQLTVVAGRRVPVHRHCAVLRRLPLLNVSLDCWLASTTATNAHAMTACLVLFPLPPIARPASHLPRCLGEVWDASHLTHCSSPIVQTRLGMPATSLVTHPFRRGVGHQPPRLSHTPVVASFQVWWGACPCRDHLAPRRSHASHARLASHILAPLC